MSIDAFINSVSILATASACNLGDADCFVALSLINLLREFPDMVAVIPNE
jgi:hypothetical protein